jgi:uncharacterized protein (TIGR02598 family)
MNRIRFQRLPVRNAFSLVEVVIALGVTSFALLSMVALIPMGLMQAREASDTTTESQIVQFARNKIEMMPFASISTLTNGYFDNQGLPTTPGAPEQIYTVSYGVTNVSMSTAGNSTANSMFVNTAANTTATIATNAVVVQVSIVNRTVPGTAATNVFPIVVPNSGF